MKKYTLIGNIIFYIGIAVFVVGLFLRDADSGNLSKYQEYGTEVMIGGIVVVLLTNFFRKKKSDSPKPVTKKADE